MAKLRHPNDPEPWMDEARQIAAQCWCDPETSDRTMDTQLAEAVARRIATWMDTAARFSEGLEYYRGLVIRCGEALGEDAYTCDDGTKSMDVLCAMVPEVLEKHLANGQTPTS